MKWRKYVSVVNPSGSTKLLYVYNWVSTLDFNQLCNSPCVSEMENRNNTEENSVSRKMYSWCGQKRAVKAFYSKYLNVIRLMNAFITRIFKGPRKVPRGFWGFKKVKYKEKKKKMEYKSYQKIFHLKFSCRRERGAEIKHKRAGKNNLQRKANFCLSLKLIKFASVFSEDI